MNLNKKILLSFCFLYLYMTLSLNAQSIDKPLSQPQLEELVTTLSDLLMKNYVFPKVAEKMKSHVAKRLKEGAYKGIDDPEELAEKITQDFQSISKDKHINVRWNPEMASEMNQVHTKQDSIEYMDLMDQREASGNFGFEEVKMISNGIGYLKLDGFSGSKLAGETATSAMNFLKNSKALIIDLRQNGGGSPDMIQLLSTYFFDNELVHLNSFYFRPSDEITQRWTLPYVPGPRLDEVDLYILTSNRTFSAAEEFSYNLKNLKRATLVGETTGGGAHPGGVQVAVHGFVIFVPEGRAINPITKTNWEGTGVSPNIGVPSAEALTEAHVAALKKLAAGYTGEDNPYLWELDGLKAKASPFNPDAESLKEFQGSYGPRIIEFKDGLLYYQRQGNDQYKLIPMKKDYFMISEIPYFRVRFIRENGKIIAFEGLYDNGNVDRNEKVIRP